eukprot:TRINITY_DN14392_c0_g2_i1.p1 TRINITY_DN14392_c0_g2~~TRINITY_DN14392_c0_g2_i1.p1  ORF type:complete len:1466 (-),score=316.65 TRINITY_DN14392_c0_g2_i1:51-4448(-)
MSPFVGGDNSTPTFKAGGVAVPGSGGTLPSHASRSIGMRENNQALVELKTKLEFLLSRLNDQDTHRTGVEEIREFLQTLYPDWFPVVIACIGEAGVNLKPIGRCESTKLLGLLAEIHKDHVVPLLPRILQVVVTRLQDADLHLREACAETVFRLARALVVDIDSQAFAILLKPLFGALAEHSKSFQIGAAACICSVIQGSPTSVISENLTRLCSRLVQHLSLPLAMARPQLLMACIYAMQAVDNAEFDETLPALMPCLETCLGVSSDWQTRKQAIEVLQAIGDRLELGQSLELSPSGNPSVRPTPLQRRIAVLLEVVKNDKVRAVREAAKDVLLSWSISKAAPPSYCAAVRSNSPGASSGNAWGDRDPAPRDRGGSASSTRASSPPAAVSGGSGGGNTVGSCGGGMGFATDTAPRGQSEKEASGTASSRLSRNFGGSDDVGAAAQAKTNSPPCGGGPCGSGIFVGSERQVDAAAEKAARRTAVKEALSNAVLNSTKKPKPKARQSIFNGPANTGFFKAGQGGPPPTEVPPGAYDGEFDEAPFSEDFGGNDDDDLMQDEFSHGVSAEEFPVEVTHPANNIGRRQVSAASVKRGVSATRVEVAAGIGGGAVTSKVNDFETDGRFEGEDEAFDRDDEEMSTPVDGTELCAAATVTFGERFGGGGSAVGSARVHAEPNGVEVQTVCQDGKEEEMEEDQSTTLSSRRVSTASYCSGSGAATAPSGRHGRTDSQMRSQVPESVPSRAVPIMRRVGVQDEVDDVARFEGVAISVSGACSPEFSEAGYTSTPPTRSRYASSVASSGVGGGGAAAVAAVVTAGGGGFALPRARTGDGIMGRRTPPLPSASSTPTLPAAQGTPASAFTSSTVDAVEGAVAVVHAPSGAVSAASSPSTARAPACLLPCAATQAEDGERSRDEVTMGVVGGNVSQRAHELDKDMKYESILKQLASLAEKFRSEQSERRCSEEALLDRLNATERAVDIQRSELEAAQQQLDAQAQKLTWQEQQLASQEQSLHRLNQQLGQQEERLQQQAQQLGQHDEQLEQQGQQLKEHTHQTEEIEQCLDKQKALAQEAISVGHQASQQAVAAETVAQEALASYRGYIKSNDVGGNGGATPTAPSSVPVPPRRSSLRQESSDAEPSSQRGVGITSPGSGVDAVRSSDRQEVPPAESPELQRGFTSGSLGSNPRNVGTSTARLSQHLGANGVRPSTEACAEGSQESGQSSAVNVSGGRLTPSPLPMSPQGIEAMSVLPSHLGGVLPSSAASLVTGGGSCSGGSSTTLSAVGLSNFGGSSGGSFVGSVDRTTHGSFAPLRPESAFPQGSMQSVSSGVLTSQRKTGTALWEKVLELCDAQRFLEAYKQVIAEPEEHCLLRLMQHTGPIVERLDAESNSRLIRRLIHILSSPAKEPAITSIEQIFSWLWQALDVGIHFTSSQVEDLAAALQKVASPMSTLPAPARAEATRLLSRVSALRRP